MVSSQKLGEKLEKATVRVAALIFAAIIVLSLWFALTSQINLPKESPTPTVNPPSPYVLVEVVQLNTTTYTLTYTTTPRQSVEVVVYPEVLVVVGNNSTYTTTTIVTTTSTTWV